MSSNDGIVLGPGEGKTVLVPGHKITHKVVGADTDGAYSLLEVELDGDGPPQHIHKTEDEAFYVLEGEINVLVGERTIRVTAGSFVRIPRGTIHTFSRIGDKPAKILAIFSPAGFEQFFDEAVDLDVTDTEAYVAKGEELAEKYNMEIVGPRLVCHSCVEQHVFTECLKRESVFQLRPRWPVSRDGDWTAVVLGATGSAPLSFLLF